MAVCIRFPVKWESDAECHLIQNAHASTDIISYTAAHIHATACVHPTASFGNPFLQWCAPSIFDGTLPRFPNLQAKNGKAMRNAIKFEMRTLLQK